MIINKNFLNNRDKLGSFLILLFSIFYIRYIFDIPLDTGQVDEFFTARTLPKGLASITLLLSLIHLGLPKDANEKNTLSAAIQGYHWKPAIQITLLMLVYSLSFAFLGFVIATIAFLFVGFFILGERRLGFAAAVACGLVLFMWAVLTQLFGLFLDSGDVYRFIVGSK